MKERDIEQHFIRRVREHGGEVRKVTWRGRAHAPDRLALLPSWHFLAELKAPGETARAGQAREHVRLRRAGFTVLVLNTIEAIDTFFDRLSDANGPL